MSVSSVDDAWQRRMPWALALVAVGAWALRAAPLLHFGAFGYHIDYDEGVYFSASALLMRGLWPYRDFMFVHPPGSLLLWAPASALASPAAGFTAARVLATLLGTVSTLLVGRIAWRTWGPLPGLLAAVFYATYPEAVRAERGPFLEPLLNLLALALAYVWLSPRPPLRPPSWALCGVLCGLALSVKVPAGLWLIAALAARPTGVTWRHLLGLTLVAGATSLLLVGPFFAHAPGAFLQDVLRFQALRPLDGAPNLWVRLLHIFRISHRFSVILALLGLVLVFTRSFQPPSPSRPTERFIATAYLLCVVTFLASRSYWSQYNSHLAASEPLLAGFAAAYILRFVGARGPRVALAATLLLFASASLGLRACIRDARARAPEVLALGRYLRQHVPASASLYAFEPAWDLAADRLPASAPGAPLVVDSYAFMLQGALDSGQSFRQTREAFNSSATQAPMRPVLEQSDFLILGRRGHEQLNEESHQWLEARRSRSFPPPGQKGPDVWQRLSPVPSSGP